MSGKDENMFDRFRKRHLPEAVQREAEGFARQGEGMAEFYFRAGFICARLVSACSTPARIAPREAGRKKRRGKMRIYVAGKITGCDKAEVLAKFGHAAAMLRAKGHAVFVPTCLPDYGEDKVSHSDYMHICRAMIDVCDAVYFLRDWKESRGATEEHSYAKERRKLLSFEDEPSPGCGR